METPPSHEGEGTRSKSRRGRYNSDLESILRKSWYHLRLSVRHPSRVPTWDAIVLTAASPEQAELYEWQLSRAKRMGRIASSTVTLAVPDPEGARIGSGAATLNAISALARHFQCLGVATTQGELDKVGSDIDVYWISFEEL
ncbi:hypothetical protein GIB67_000906 [Kingdonia uniflora]|uniref:Uncharacterized protein n=1 Tax=Kingdonia uniflora TaxID=39325 RepID=A0A7J7MFI7_9MAGN|nr:hypothetical protein GIB67_000906 [Kingdonia uniflora]